MSILTTPQEGRDRKIAIAHTAINVGIDVYRPLVEGGRYDLIFSIGSKCKRAARDGEIV